MRHDTAYKVADVLGLVEAFLSQTQRPRKRPGKPRPLAEVRTLSGIKPITRLTKDMQFLDVDRVSLVGALRLACYEQGYSRHVQQVAAFEIAWAWWTNSGEAEWIDSLEGIDNHVQDTRELLRAVKRARRYVEKGVA